jgi:hypothetical protein
MPPPVDADVAGPVVPLVADVELAVDEPVEAPVVVVVVAVVLGPFVVVVVPPPAPPDPSSSPQPTAAKETPATIAIVQVLFMASLRVTKKGRFCRKTQGRVATSCPTLLHAGYIASGQRGRSR